MNLLVLHIRQRLEIVVTVHSLSKAVFHSNSFIGQKPEQKFSNSSQTLYLDSLVLGITEQFFGAINLFTMTFAFLYRSPWLLTKVYSSAISRLSG